jgi:hypothetical protein
VTTIRVRIPVYITDEGKWHAHASSMETEDENSWECAAEACDMIDMNRQHEMFWIEAEIPTVKAAPTIEGEVKQ